MVFPRRRKWWFLILLIICSVIFSLWLALPEATLSHSSSHLKINFHKLAVIVPFRDRNEELQIFVPHISNFLNRQNVQFKIFVINQTDNFRFNRAVLINIGFLVSRADNFDYLAMHDIDLLPLDSRLSYEYPENGPMHLSSPSLHPLYHYPSFVGGILLIQHKHFELVNGLSNRYWGWGLEDDEFYTRLRHKNLTIFRPDFNSTTAFDHIHNKVKRKRDFREKIPSLLKVDRKTGISTLNVDGNNGELFKKIAPSSHLVFSGPIYSIISKHDVIHGGHLATIYNVLLDCNISTTPWCLPQKSKKPN